MSSYLARKKYSFSGRELDDWSVVVKTRFATDEKNGERIVIERRMRPRKPGWRRSAVGRLLGHPSTNSRSLRKCMKHDMKCTSSDVLASGQADNQLIEACGCIFIIYYRLPNAFLHIVRHSRCQSLTYRLERISRTGCPENRNYKRLVRRQRVLGTWCVFFTYSRDYWKNVTTSIR